MGTFLLLLLTILLCSIFYVIGFVYSLARGFLHGGLKQYFYDIAFALDQAGNVICSDLFNDLWIHPRGHRMGAHDETISYVLGMNYLNHTLFPFGQFVRRTVDFFAYLFGDGRNHCLRAARKNQFNTNAR